MSEKKLVDEKLLLIEWIVDLEDESTLMQLLKIKEQCLIELREELKQMIKDCNNPDILYAVKILAESHLRQKGILQ